MKGRITVRKEHYGFLEQEFKSFAIYHQILDADDANVLIEVDSVTMQQFYSAVLLAGMTHAFKEGEGYLKNALKVKPFTENELTQL